MSEVSPQQASAQGMLIPQPSLLSSVHAGVFYLSQTARSRPHRIDAARVVIGCQRQESHMDVAWAVITHPEIEYAQRGVCDVTPLHPYAILLIYAI